VGSPLDPSARLSAIDMVRGVAVLGILAVNMPYFAMPTAWAEKPHTYLDMSPADHAAWVAVSVLAEGKFVTLFSLLFGAGVWLVTERLDATDRPAAVIHYTRMAWLLAFGLVHAYLIWPGDVLVPYAIIGLALFPLRPLSVHWQLVIAGGSFLAGAGVLGCCVMGLSLIEALDPGALGDFALYEPDDFAAEIAAYTGGYLGQMPQRIHDAMYMHAIGLPLYGPWFLALMLLGMVAMRTGVLAGEWSPAFYRNVLLVGVALLPVQWLVTQLRADDLTGHMLAWFLNYWIATAIGLAWGSGIILLAKSAAMTRLADPLAATGRMALTNYLLSSLICTTIFYGHGLGLFTTRGHAWLLGLTVAIWITLLGLSTVWLARYRYGPMEWLWRSLTYRRMQPIRRNA
jgi:uncharacterized protein